MSVFSSLLALVNNQDFYLTNEGLGLKLTNFALVEREVHIIFCLTRPVLEHIHEVMIHAETVTVVDIPP